MELSHMYALSDMALWVSCADLTEYYIFSEYDQWISNSFILNHRKKMGGKSMYTHRKFMVKRRRPLNYFSLLGYPQAKDTEEISEITTKCCFEHIYHVRVFLFLGCHVFYFVLCWWCHFLLKSHPCPSLYTLCFPFSRLLIMSRCYVNIRSMLLDYLSCLALLNTIYPHMDLASVTTRFFVLAKLDVYVEKKTGSAHPDRSLRADVLLIWAVDLHYVEISYLGYNASAI